MSGRRRPATRRTESVEPTDRLAPRQTRSSARRPKASLELESRPPAGTAQDGSRGRGASGSVAMSDFPKGSASQTGSEPRNPSLLPIFEATAPSGSAATEADDTREAPDIDDDRIEDMLDFDIPKLTRWSGKMYDVLSSMDSDQPTADDLSRLSSARKFYNHARLPFADTSTLFIKPINLSDDYDPAVRAKIRVAICSGNMLSLLALIIDVRVRKKEPLPILEQLDDAFPASFNPYFHVDEDTEKTLDLGFRIRSRRLVELLVADPSADPYELAISIFYAGPKHLSGNAQEAPDDEQLKPLAAININKENTIHSAYRGRVQNIISMLSASDRSEIRSTLDQDFPMEKLLDDIRSWASRMYKQINQPTFQSGAQVTSPALGSSAHDTTGRGESEPLFVDNSNEAKDSDSTSNTDIGEYDRLPEQESNQNFINSSATLAAIRQSEGQATIHPASTSLSDRHTGEGKRNELDIGDAIRRLEPREVLGRIRKRPRPDEDDGSEEGYDDFEVNEQLRDESRRTRNNNVAARNLSTKCPQDPRQSRASGPRLQSLPVTSQQDVRRRPGDGSPEDPSLQEQDILVLSQEARSIRRSYYANRPRQHRVPWSASDTSRLLELIADPSLNCSWSSMEKVGGFENPRTQQALRDKARGLKVWYLEGDRILPPGFDQIALGQKEKAAVIRCGRNPNRQEDDLDEDGRIINNIWVD